MKSKIQSESIVIAVVLVILYEVFAGGNVIAAFIVIGAFYFICCLCFISLKFCGITRRFLSRFCQ